MPARILVIRCACCPATNVDHLLTDRGSVPSPGEHRVSRWRRPAHIIHKRLTLTSGTRLGVYEILSALGAGGMGEVYRTRDTRLDRLVAIMVLPDGFAADTDRVARFEGEAKTVVEDATTGRMACSRGCAPWQLRRSEAENRDA